jgi:DNA-binding NtrC family response regulator
MASSEGRVRSILVLEDDSDLSEVLSEFLRQQGWQVETAMTAAEASQKIESGVFELVLVDYLLPDADGLTIVEEIQRRSPSTQVMLMTGLQDMEVASRAFKMGAGDLIAKPFQVDELLSRIEELLERKASHLHQSIETDVGMTTGFHPVGIIGESPAIKKILHLIGKVANRNASVLITGESGTGKELVAAALHHHGRRREKPFITINCGAIPDNLLEDELFGHVRGAYTDARQSRAGKLEEVNGGTLFLDEIGEMPPALQVKLLRILEDKTFQRLGSNQTIRVDFRLVTATNADLRERMREGAFREDLFYRLNVVPIQLPPLRERKEDLPLLVNHFLSHFSREYQEPIKQLDADALRLLNRHDWPGNVRELRNVIEMGFIMSGNRQIIQSEDVPLLQDEIAQLERDGLIPQVLELPEDGINLNQAVSEFERTLITQSLERTGGNKGKAARLLYLKRTTLVEKLRRMDLLTQFSK